MCSCFVLPSPGEDSSLPYGSFGNLFEPDKSVDRATRKIFFPGVGKLGSVGTEVLAGSRGGALVVAGAKTSEADVMF